MKAIKCMSCKNKIIGDMSFSELSEKNKWIKAGEYYICPECQKPKEKILIRPVRQYLKRGK